MKKYEEINSLEIDVMREIGSIGTGNAATALSQMMNRKIKMTMPEVQILGFNEAITKLGDPEMIVSGVLVNISGELNGVMLYLQNLDLINIMLEHVLTSKIDDFSQLGELEISALVEIGNIMISSYVSAISKLTGISINLSVPAMSVNMLGGIMSVPMLAFGHQTDKLMIINGKFVVEDKEVYSNLLLMPDIPSLNYLLKKLGVLNE